MRSLLRTRMLLLAGASAIALVVATPQARAADRPAPVMKAPRSAPSPELRVFLEGAGFWSAGDRVHFFRFDPDDEFAIGRRYIARPGWEVAFGFDHRATGSPWHTIAQLRYGRAANRSFEFRNDPGYPTIAAGTHGEHHWAADFAVGRDLGIGAGQNQLNVGLRVAEIATKTEATGTINFGSIPHMFDIEQRSRFLGVGPRAAVQGSTPPAGAWTVDYELAVAVLFGDRKVRATGTAEGTFGGPISFSSSSNGAVLNLEAMAGLSYWFSPNAKFTVGYRFDGYWNALRTFNSDGDVTNGDRHFHGPFVRVTGKR